MRMIGTIPRGEDAERFSDYLVTQKIGNMVEESAGGEWSVWIERDDDIDRGKTELSGFLADPRNSIYQSTAKAERIRKQEEAKQQKLRKRFVDVRTSWGQPQQWAAPITLSLIVLSILFSIASGSIGLGKARPLLDKLLYVSVNEVRYEQWQQTHPDFTGDRAVFLGYWLDHLEHGEVWRLITPIFLHWSILHLVFNLFWTRDLGTMIERGRGTWRFLGLVSASAIISNFAQYVWSGPEYGGGMSGVVYALFGYVWICGRLRPYLGLGVSQQTVVLMIVWLFACMTGYLGPIGNVAHVSGLLVGMACAFFPYLVKRMGRV